MKKCVAKPALDHLPLSSLCRTPQKIKRFDATIDTLLFPFPPFHESVPSIPTKARTTKLGGRRHPVPDSPTVHHDAVANRPLRHLFSSPLLFVLDGQPRRRSRRGRGDVVRSTMFRDRSPGFVDRPIVRSLAGSPRVRCFFFFVSLAKPSRRHHSGRHCVRSAWESAQPTAQLLPFSLLLSVDAGPPPYCLFVISASVVCVCSRLGVRGHRRVAARTGLCHARSCSSFRDTLSLHSKFGWFGGSASALFIYLLVCGYS